ncbi:PhoU domain-containing protein [Methanomethylovorans sp.]|uniref:PhoU domain-containing protein n=1 Tax=Methanomethylovorans sp. TaxID=2758717 RepID=UPI00351C3AEA
MGCVDIDYEQRKIQLTGGSTYIISLPIKWIRGCGLNSGDSLTLIPRSDHTLLLSADLSTDSKKVESMMEISPDDTPEDNFRILVSHYLAGYDLIRLVSKKGFHAQDRKFFKDVTRKRLIGIEVIEESRNEIILQSLMNYQELPLNKALQNMSRLITSMLEDVMLALKNHDLELASDIVNRDNEVDRFYLLTVRQLKVAVEDPKLAEKIGIERPRQCLGYRLVTKILERIGDHVERIAQQIIIMDVTVPEKDAVFAMGVFAQKIFADSFRALEEKNIKYSNKVVNYAKKFDDYTMMRDGQGALSCTSEHMDAIIQSLNRISEYSADIAEMSINMGSERDKEK